MIKTKSRIYVCTCILSCTNSYVSVKDMWNDKAN